MFAQFLSVAASYAGQILPWFFIGLVLSIYIEHRYRDTALPKFFSEYRPTSVAALLFVGMISPFSILSGLPLATQLIRQGAHPALLLSFFAAERVYDLHSFPIIGGIFSWQFSIINALIVFAALFVASWAVKGSDIAYRARPSTPIERDGWKKHAKMLGVVTIGIGVAALFRVLVPEATFAQYAGSLVGGIGTALVLGFFLYVGTIAGNYPLAGAFSELGMHGAGLMTYLSASSLLNVVILALFASSMSPRAVVRYFVVYAAVATTLSVLYGGWIGT
ncbi:MAG TPA: permease [Candidatus Paceibacterota bacterium]|nr:permease [Candidatus Paceibacterota bacterium]